MESIKFNDTSEYKYLNVLGVDGVFTTSSIDGSTLPDGFYKYALHGNNASSFNQISNNTLPNHVGDFICKEPIELGPTQTKAFTVYDWSYQSNKEFDFKAYFDC